VDWRSATKKFDTSWARRPAAQMTREVIITGLLGPLINYYTHPRVTGLELFDGLKPAAIFVANHSSHLDTPSILRAMPKKWRRKTATVAAADYFYKNRIVASLVTLTFATIPIERKGGVSDATKALLRRLVDEKWNILLYPEGTRSRDGRMGKLKSGAAFLALEYNLPLVPTYVQGTHDAMPVGRPWPTKHDVVINFGPAVYPGPGEDRKVLNARLEAAFAALQDKAHP
jgi:1-acyl-sn-glycerol-3-phosphate acyltransferase